MGERFFNESHIRQKLNGTICLIKGEPYIVHHLGGDTMECLPIGSSTKSAINVDYTSDDFDYTHIPLGYMAWRGTAHYLAREPQRINTQGLTIRAISFDPVINENTTTISLSKHFRDCILGKHPSFEKALKMISGDANTVSVPFDRHFAVQRVSRGMYTVLYRGRVVALSENRGSSFRVVECPCPSLIRTRLEKVGVVLD